MNARKILTLTSILIFLISGCSSTGNKIGDLASSAMELVPAYATWCGPGRTANDSETATLADVPKDMKDAVCWLHDRETGKALSYWDPFRKLAGWNAASRNFVWRQKNDLKPFVDAWWSARLSQDINVPVAAFDEDYSRLYKPASRRLFKVLYLPFIHSKGLLKGSIDESLVGPPPSP